MPIIIPFETGWIFIQHMIDKLIYLILLWSWIYRNSVITSLHSLINYVCNVAWNHLPEWKSTPYVRWDKNRHKTSHGAGGFAQKLCISKESNYNERNCRSGRHNRRYPFIRCKPWKICQDTNTTSRPGTEKRRNLLLLVNEIEWFVLYIVGKLLNI